MAVSSDFARMRMFSMNPVVGVIEKFIDKRLCQSIRDDAAGLLQQSTVAHEQNPRMVDKEVRTGEVAYVPHGKNKVLDDARRRLSTIFDIDADNCESAQVVCYGPTQQYKAHFDAFPFRADHYPHNLRTQGQRYYTGLLYLTDDFTGGHTEFPKLGIKVAPKMGRMLFWSNVVIGGNSPHPQSLHAGTPVIKGEKWAVTFWFRKPPVPDPVQLMPAGADLKIEPKIQLIQKDPFA